MAQSTPSPIQPLGFEADLFKAADKLRGNMEPSDYKHVALGLIFLKYISDAFEARHKALLAEDPQAAEDRDEYLADNVFWVPKDARWSHLQANAKLPTIGTLIDDAMRAIEKDNESLKGVLPKDYARRCSTPTRCWSRRTVLRPGWVRCRQTLSALCRGVPPTERTLPQKVRLNSRH